MPNDPTEFATLCQQRIEQQLKQLFPEPDGPTEKLQRALQYSVFNGGKRIRPFLCYAAANATGGINPNTDIVAASIELIHTYSLIHDDLPCMDDDDLRRGKPTCHIAFDEATAVLAGDALQACAFEHLCNLDLKNPSAFRDYIKVLSQAAGVTGMVGGQAIDINATDTQLSLTELQLLHTKKTGALILCSVQLGAMSTEQVSEQQLAKLSTYGEKVGLAFQIQDDILDVVSDTDTLGKQQGADIARNKPTFVSILGLEKARETAQKLVDEAIDTLASFDHNADHLRALAQHIISRKH